MKSLKNKLKTVIKSKGGGSDWYSFDHMVETYPDATYYMAFSERGNGKTTDLLTRCLKNYKEKKWQGALIRRRETAFIGQAGDNLFNDLVQRGVVSKIFEGEWTGIYHAGTRWYLCREVEVTKRDGTEETKREINRDPILYGFTLDGGAVEDGKGARYPRVNEIYFDEFLSRTRYLSDEFVLFTNQVSTIIGNRAGVKIFMAGNTVSYVSCPYFREMGLDRVKKQEQGTIDLYKYGDTGLTLACEYCRNREKSKDNEKYFAFGNPRLKMITDGKWEVAIHPHIPVKLRDSDKLFKFYIYFDGEYMECSIAVILNSPVLCVQAKTTGLKCPDDDLIYSDKYDTRPNWRRSIYRDTLPISAKLRQYVANGRVFFSDNMTGEIFEAYMRWARQNT